MPYEISAARREEYRLMSERSRNRKRLALDGRGPKPAHPINVPQLKPEDLMPSVHPHGLSALSLFSGGGGLDLGFERAGFSLVASYEILDICGETLRLNRPGWTVKSGSDGDVKTADWRIWKN